MPIITRYHDQVNFVIPDYRELVTVKKRSLLRKEVSLLTQNYGEYVFIRKKNSNQYEVTFAREQGFLLGETVWNHFGKPPDLIYCESIPHQDEVLLVVVKSGSVFLDVQLPLDSVVDELAVFRNQISSFEIYIYGDVPVSETPRAGYFSLDKKSVKSFTELSDSLFDNLVVSADLQVLPLNQVLRKQGLGAFPIKQTAIYFIVIVVIWYFWDMIKVNQYTRVLPSVIIGVVDPFARFINALASPAPDQEIKQLVDYISLIMTNPGWSVVSISYNSNAGFTANLLPQGGSAGMLQKWAFINSVNLSIDEKGVALTLPNQVKVRQAPGTIYVLRNVVANLIDKVNLVMPGSAVKINVQTQYSNYKEMKLVIIFSGVSLDMLLLLGEQLANLPFVLNDSELSISSEGDVSGQLLLTVLGN